MDTIIKNGLIVTADGRFEGSIGIVGEEIAGIYAPGEEPEAAEVIDAAGLAVMPGAIDTHSHHREGSEPGFEYKETIETATLQCAVGGVTTTVGMPNVNPPVNSAELLRRQFAVYEREAYVDYNFNPAGTVLDEMPELATMGIIAFKVFMVVDSGRPYPHMSGIGVHEHGRLFRIMKECARLGHPLMVHPHDQSLMTAIEEEFWARGERDCLAYAKAYAAHDGLLWDSSVALLLRLAKAADCHLHILHVQTEGTVKMIRQAKAEGQKVTCEINPWAIFLGCDWATVERLGSYALSYWVPEKNLPELWAGLNDGTIDMVATDHAPHTREEKEWGWTDGWKAHTGTQSTQHYLSLCLTAAHQGKLSLESVVRLCCTEPARVFGIEKKGEIRPGYDADLVLVDLDREYTIRDEDALTRVGWTPYAGQTVTGVPVRTILRGRTVFAGGKVVGAKGYGRLARGG
ncbi:dihydroorotase family protein [Oleispirillum naphthae]|uniref:dihydroorotase n=1 Tax=Oleispirillum naphthae TaxID=2838853 RepID=UPI00308261B2